MKKALFFIVGTYINTLSYLSKSVAGQKAISLFSKPKKGRISRVQGEFLDTAYKEELKYIDYHIMTYRWLGSKPTVLLVHGWESNSARWKPLILNLKNKGFGVVTLDAPAHGNSGSDNFNALLYSEFIYVVAKKFNVEIMIGHSVGGMASVMCQHTYQLPHVKKMILLGAPSEFTGLLDRYSSMLGYNQRVKFQMNTVIIERFGKDPKSISTANYLKNISSKGLIIHDEEDEVIPYNEALLMKNTFKNSTLKTTKGLGHSYTNDKVAEYINEFIEN